MRVMVVSAVMIVVSVMVGKGTGRRLKRSWWWHRGPRGHHMSPMRGLLRNRHRLGCPLVNRRALLLLHRVPRLTFRVHTVTEFGCTTKM
jgi:hypothetical protein